MMIRTLQTLYPQRHLVLLGCAVLPAVFGHSWLQSGSIVAALWAVKDLSEAHHWKRRIHQIRAAVEERIPGAEILDWERPVAIREWGAGRGVIQYPFVCRLIGGEVVRCKAVTDAQSLQILSFQAARPGERHQEVYEPSCFRDRAQRVKEEL
jgi:hypothetical protein